MAPPETTAPHTFFSDSRVNEHGTASHTGLGPHFGTSYPRVVKRSFKRALKRAQQVGSAWYRGRLLLESQLQGMYVSLDAQRTNPLGVPILRAPKRHRPGRTRRLRHLCWNAGGLSQARFSELRQWLGNKYDVVVITETRWSFEHAWQSSDWAFYHSGTNGDLADGVLIMVATKFHREVSWHTLVPGRLVHVKLLRDSRDIDILGFYQHVFHSNSEQIQKRQQLLTVLDTTLRQLPTRNPLLLTGDMNMNLTANAPWIGTSQCRWDDRLHTLRPHQDSCDLQRLLADHQLVALNTFNCHHPPTYVHNQHCSRIDYIITRRPWVDHQSKQTITHVDLPFQSVDVGHFPLETSIPLDWQYHRGFSHQGITFRDRLFCRNAWQRNTADWQALTSDLSSRLSSSSSSPSPDSFIRHFHSVVIPPLKSFLPSPSSTPADPSPLLLTKWQHFAAMRKPGLPTLLNLFMKWRHWTQFHKLKLMHRQHVRRMKRTQADELHQEARHCADFHDSHGLYGLIKKHCPKSRYRRIHLRLPNGQLASKTEELQLYTDHIHMVWHGPAECPTPFAIAPGVPFTQDDLLTVLQQLPVNKAVAQPFAPNLVWKVCAESVVPQLYEALQQWWGVFPPVIPTTWKTSWLTFIDKPLKSPHFLKNLRPLALQEPLGKGVAKLLARLASDQIHPTICRYPNYAYQKYRHTYDAIRTVVLHCQAARHLTRQQRLTVEARRDGARSEMFVGGIQFLIDLQDAFNQVNRQRLFSHIHRTGLSPELCVLLAAWHSHTPLCFNHYGMEHTYDSGKGVRQGCVMAPMLWTCVLHDLFLELEQKLGYAWLIKHLTLFADDIHISSLFHSWEELESILQTFGLILDTLNDAGFATNADKSQILLTCGGTKKQHFLRKLVTVTRQGSFIQVPLRRGPVPIPLVKQTKYLGIQIGYQSFEDATMTYRLRQAQSSFARLRRWLTCKALTTTQRIRLWHTCIVPITLYGIPCMTHSPKALHAFQVQMFKQLRIVIGDHAYRTHRTHQDVLTLHRSPSPCHILLEAIHQLQRTLHNRLFHLLPADCLHSITWDHFPVLIASVMHMASAGPTVIADPDQPIWPNRLHRCPHCDFCTDHLANLRRHRTNIHGDTNFRKHDFHPTQHAINGIPQCTFCLRTFSSWYLLHQHVDLRICQDPKRHRPMPTSSTPVQGHLTDAERAQVLAQPWGPQLIQWALNSCWHDVVLQREMSTFLKNTCLYCGTWHQRTQELNAHMKKFHAHLIPCAYQVSAQLVASEYEPDSGLCPFCQDPYRKTHTCPVAVQVAMLVYGATPDEDYEPYTCYMCQSTFTSPDDLWTHLRQDHLLSLFDYVPSRDSVYGDAICAHCSTGFTQPAGLRCHIQFGRCKFFNPNKPAVEVDLDLDILDHMWTGNLNGLLRDPVMSNKLTLQCLCCDRCFNRSQDLAAHLQTVHREQFMLAQPAIQMLLHLVYPVEGCVCNPPVKVAGPKHSCIVLQQLGMMHQRALDDMVITPTQNLHGGLFIPAAQLEDALRTLELHLADPWRARLESILTHREFAFLWFDPDLRQMGRHFCWFCGLGSLDIAELHMHLLTEHFQDFPAAPHFLHQLAIQVAKAASQSFNDHQCFMCWQVFQLPDASVVHAPSRTSVAQKHLQFQCPTLVQLALILAAPFNDRNGVWGRRRRDGRGIGSTGTHLHQGHEQQQATTQGRSRPGRRKRKHETSPTTVGGHDSDVAEARQGSVTQPLRRYFSHSHANSTTWSPAHDDSGGRSLEIPEGEPTREDTLPSPMPSPTKLLQSDGLQTEGVDHSGRSRSNMAEGGCGQTVESERLLAVSEVVPTTEDPPNQRDQTPHTDERSTPTDGGNRGTAPGRVPDSQVPQPSAHVEPGSGPMEASDECQNQLVACLADKVVAQRSMECGGMLGETTHGSSKPPSDAIAAAGTKVQPAGQRQRQGQGQEQAGDSPTGPLTEEALRTLVLQVVYDNPSNHCFVNATVKGLLWAQLCTRLGSTFFWGKRAAQLTAFLTEQRGRTDPILIAATPWGRELRDRWGSFSCQADVAEFTATLLSWFDQPGWQWERREVDLQGVLTIKESMYMQTPITLYIDQDYPPTTTLLLKSLVNAWHQESTNSRISLTTAPALVCLRIERWINPAQELQLVSCPILVNHVEELPIFEPQSMQSNWMHYVPTVLVSHLGMDQAGHFVVALKVVQGTQLAWLICDDSNAPVLHHNLPVHFTQGIVLIWMAKDDTQILHDYNRSDWMSVFDCARTRA
eukprot:Skav215936  [mRNA]  locus=scaffold226:478217:484972:+ [translate_table: standard]